MKGPIHKEKPWAYRGKKTVKECIFELKLKIYIIFYDSLLINFSNFLLNITYEIFTCSYLKNLQEYYDD